MFSFFANVVFMALSVTLSFLGSAVMVTLVFSAVVPLTVPLELMFAAGLLPERLAASRPKLEWSRTGAPVV